MAEQWYAIVEKATSRLHATATVIADAETLAAGGFEAVEMAFNPQESPDGDPDGCYDWDTDKREFTPLSGAATRLKRLAGLRKEEAALETIMLEKAEEVPPRDVRV